MGTNIPYTALGPLIGGENEEYLDTSYTILPLVSKGSAGIRSSSLDPESPVEVVLFRTTPRAKKQPEVRGSWSIGMGTGTI